jgi:hypothetical protein
MEPGGFHSLKLECAIFHPIFSRSLSDPGVIA